MPCLDPQALATGGCQCGGLRYQLSAPPLAAYVCHCRECQKQSASAFGISLMVPTEAFRLTRGDVRFWARPAAQGGQLTCAFCPSCGSRLWHQAARTPEMLSVKGGSLDQPPDLSAAIHIWTTRKLPGVLIPAGLQQFPEEPD